MPPCSFGFELTANTWQELDCELSRGCTLHVFSFFFFSKGLGSVWVSVGQVDCFLALWRLGPSPGLADLLQINWFAGWGFIAHAKTVSCKICLLELKLWIPLLRFQNLLHTPNKFGLTEALPCQQPFGWPAAMDRNGASMLTPLPCYRHVEIHICLLNWLLWAGREATLQAGLFVWLVTYSCTFSHSYRCHELFLEDKTNLAPSCHEWHLEQNWCHRYIKPNEMEAHYRKTKTIQNKKGHPLGLCSYFAPNFLLKLVLWTVHMFWTM